MMEYSPMLVVMLWALTPSDATGSGVAAKVKEVPTPGMTVHQESYFTFNHGKPFLAEQDPLTGAILNLRTTPVSQDDYAYEEEEEEGDGIDRKDSPKVFTRNDIAQPSKDPDLHKFLNLPVHYSSNDKFPLISSSYANTKVQGHGASSYSNHRLNPTTTTTVSPSYYSLKTSTAQTSTDRQQSVTSTITTAAITTTTSTTTTTTPKPTTTTAPKTKTTTRAPPSYEYEYEYDYDHEPEPENKKTTTQSILDFFDKDYAFLGASEEEKNTTKTDYILSPPSSEKPKDRIEMVAPNTNIFIPPDYLKPTTEKFITTEKENRTSQNEITTVKIATTTEVSVTKLINEIKPNNETEKLSNNEIDKSNQSTENSLTEKAHSNENNVQYGMKITFQDKPETTTNKIEPSTIASQPSEKKPVILFPTTLVYDNKQNKTKVTTIIPTDEEKSSIPPQKTPIPSTPVKEELRPSETMVPPAIPTEFFNPYTQLVNRPQSFIPQQKRPQENLQPFNPYQQPPTKVPTEMLPPKRPIDSHYPRPQQDRPFTDILHYRPIEQAQQNNKPTENLGSRPSIHNSLDNKPVTEPTSHQPQQPFLPTPVQPMETRPLDTISPISGSKPSATRPTGASTRPEPSVTLQNRPYHIPVRQETQQPSRPSEPHGHTRPETAQNQNRVPSHPTNVRYPPYTPLRPQEGKLDHRPYIPEYRPPNPRPEHIRPPLGIPEFVSNRDPQIGTENKNRPDTESNKQYHVQFSQPSKVESHFIKVGPGQENPSYSLQTSFSIGVPPAEETQQQSASNANPSKKPQPGNTAVVGQVLFPDEEEKRPWNFQEDKRPNPQHSDSDKYPRPSWESHLKPPLVFNHLRKETYIHKRPKPRPDLPNILPQFRPNAKIGHAEPHVYFKTPLDTLQPPPLPRPQFLRAELEEEKPVHRRNGQSTRVTPINTVQIPKRGALRSEDEKTDPVFVVYPSNNAQDGVVVGTRGSQRPLPPDNLEIEDSFPLDTNKNFQARVDTPILKGKATSKPPIKNDFPYTLIKPTEAEEKIMTTVTKEYTAFSPTTSPEKEKEKEKEPDTEINIIPYLQDYMPFATKKPSQEPPVWNVGDDIKPISVTLKTQKTEETTTKIDNHKTTETPTPQDFQAPFHASLSAPNQGWSVVRPRPDPDKEGETTTEKVSEEQEGKFDIQNFKPQLFGGFKPIIPPTENKEPSKEEKEKV